MLPTSCRHCVGASGLRRTPCWARRWGKNVQWSLEGWSRMCSGAWKHGQESPVGVISPWYDCLERPTLWTESTFDRCWGTIEAVITCYSATFLKVIMKLTRAVKRYHSDSDFLKNTWADDTDLNNIVFQRVHRLGRKKPGEAANGRAWCPRQIIAGFRNF